MKFPSLNYGYELLKELNITKNDTSYTLNDVLLLQKSLLRINVFYETLTYDFITESPTFTYLTFILNLGYTMGLFFGKLKIFWNFWGPLLKKKNL